MSAVLPLPAISIGWRTALVTWCLFALLLTVLYFDTAAAMVGIWNRSETFAHAFLVPPIALWLIWRRRDELAALQPQPQPWMLPLLAAFAGLWLMADLVLVNAASQFAFVAMLVLSVPALLGLRVAHVILFPLLFLFFAVPIGEFMTDPMMRWTADFTVAALRLSGIPVYREGLQFVIPSGNWSVVEACSGVRYLIASFMVGTLFAYLNYQTWQRRAMFMLVSILVPIVANWLRAYGIVMLGHHSGNTLAVGADHLVYGWAFFGIVIFIMFMIGARWSEPDPVPIKAGPDSAGAAGFAARAQPKPGSKRGLAPMAAGLLAVLLAPHALLWGLQQIERDAAPVALTLPASLDGGWRQIDASGSFAPAFEGPAVAVQSRYADASGATVGVYIAYYRAQGDGRKLVSSVNQLARSEDSQWNQVASGALATRAADGVQPWRTAVLLGRAQDGARRQQLTAWRSYWIDGRWVASDVQAKLFGALARLRGRGDDGAAVVIWVDADSRDEARAQLERFTQQNLGSLQTLLAATHQAR